MKWQTISLGFQAFHAELQMSSMVAWTLEPFVEEMPSKKTQTPGEEGRQL